MEVTLERPQPCEVVLTIVPDEDQFKKARERAIRGFAPYVNVPGFRKGKAPPRMIESLLDADRLSERAREIVTEIAYKAALAEQQIEPFAQGSIEETEDDGAEKPFSFKVRVPLVPVVTLGDLEGISAERRPIPITDDDVEQDIQRMLRSFATMELSTDPIGDGDTAYCDLDTTIGEEALAETRPASFVVGENMLELDNALRGATAGETREADVAYPDDYTDPRYAGKTVRFTLRINHVVAKRVPELTDELVRERTSYESVDQLRAAVRAQREIQARRAEEDDLAEQLLEGVTQRSTIEFPPVILDREVASDLQELTSSLEQREITLEDYLRQTNSNIQKLQEQMAASAKRRIVRTLVMMQLARDYDIRVTDEEFKAEIEETAARSGLKPSRARRQLRDEGRLDDLRETLNRRKIIRFLKQRAGIEDDASAREGEDEPIPATT